MSRPNTAQRPARFCEWKADDDGNYEARCGEAFTFIHGTPAENNFKYCPYCGREIKNKSELCHD